MKNKSVKVLLSAITVLLMAWALESCSKKDNPTPATIDKTALNAEITVATNLLSSTSEGTGTGDYLKGSQATLQGVLTTAEAVAASTTSTQSDVTNALAQLTAAVLAYQGSIIVPVDQADLVGQWTFDELTTAAAGTTVKDYSGLGHDGKLTAGSSLYATGSGMPYSGYVVSSNVPTLTTDRYGVANKALHFDGGANVQIPYSTDLNPAAMTISLWAKADTLTKYWASNYMVAMNRWNGFKFQLQDTPREFLTVHAAGVQSSACGCSKDTTYYNYDQNAGKIAPITQWYHYVATFGNGHMTFYINGVLVYDWGAHAGDPTLIGTIVNLNAKTSVANSPVDLTIGQGLPTSQYSSDSNSPFNGPDGFFIGSMDEVRIYKVPLSAAQVLAIYNQEKP